MNGCQLPGCRKSLFLANQTEPYLQAHVPGLGNSTGLGRGRWGCSASLLALGLQLRTAQGPGPAGALSPQIGSGSPGGSGSHQASPGLPPPADSGSRGSALREGGAGRGGARGGAAPPLAHWLGRVTWPWPKPRGLPAGPPSPHSHLGLRPAWGRGSRPRRCPLWRGMVLAEGLACAVWEAEGPPGFSTPPSVAAPSSDHPRGLHTMPRPWGGGYVARSRRLKTLDWWRGEGALVVSRRKEQQDGNSFPSQGR